MRYGIISDVHSNLEALQSVIQACRDEGARLLFCAGDIVGYGANPKEFIALLKQYKVHCVAGNHDWAVMNKLDMTDFHPAAQEAVIWTRKQLDPDSRTFLEELPLSLKQDDFIVVHAALNNPQLFNYLHDLKQAQDTFYLMDRNICFLGHTHVPQIMVKKEKTYLSRQLTIEIMPECKYIVNVGSVGQPRDQNPTASFCIYDPDLKRIAIKRVAYDVKLAQHKILQAGLPSILANRLTIGQ